MIIQEDIELLGKRLDWDIEEIECTNKEGNSGNGYYSVQGIDNTTREPVEGDLFIDDGISIGFDYSVYKRLCPEKKTLIAIFSDYDRERYMYNNAHYAKAEERNFRMMWETKVSIYREASTNIKLTIDKEGINFLEFKNDEIEGFCFNAKMDELQELLRVTGTNLYRDNVRVGITRSVLSKRLKELFRDYIITAIIGNLEFCNKYDVKDELEKALINERQSLLFWYSHNGITIYSKRSEHENNSSIKRYASIVELQPNDVSVINGAQTITDFQIVSEEMKQKLVSLDNRIDDKVAQETVKEALALLMVKTTIIDGPAELVGTISLGLNTQIPVGDDEQVANTKYVKSINSKLEGEELRIVRAGEYIDDYCMLPKRFVKLFIAAQSRPGLARNLDTKKISEYIKDASLIISKDKTIVQLLKKVIHAERWWHTNKQYRIDHSQGIENIMKNARYYYCSYWIECEKKAINDEVNEPVSYEKVYDSLVEKIRIINDSKKKGEELNSNSFKNEQVFSELMEMLKREGS